MNNYLKVWKNYATFSGRARRTEFWEFNLINWGVCLLIAFIAIGIPKLEFIISIYGLAIFIPSLAVQVRRMHDVGKSGWFLLIQLIPLIGGIWILVLELRAGEVGSNRFGDDPKLEDTFGRKEDNQEMGEGI